MAGTAAHMRESAALKGLLKSLLKTVKRRSLTSMDFGQGRRKWTALRRVLLRAPSSSAFVCRCWALLAGADWGWGNPYFSMIPSLTDEKMVWLSPISMTHLAASPGLPAEGAWGAMGGCLPYPVP